MHIAGNSVREACSSLIGKQSSRLLLLIHDLKPTIGMIIPAYLVFAVLFRLAAHQCGCFQHQSVDSRETQLIICVFDCLQCPLLNVGQEEVSHSFVHVLIGIRAGIQCKIVLASPSLSGNMDALVLNPLEFRGSQDDCSDNYFFWLLSSGNFIQ